MSAGSVLTTKNLLQMIKTVVRLGEEQNPQLEQYNTLVVAYFLKI